MMSKLRDKNCRQICVNYTKNNCTELQEGIALLKERNHTFPLFIIKMCEWGHHLPTHGGWVERSHPARVRIHHLAQSPGEGNGNPLQYSCLENPMDRGAWWATVHEVERVGHDLTTKPPLLYMILNQ
ncbi:hypothetical protein FD755_018107 [Muntiacus reevesi]|uniref:Uncharacterized protein n=1 Tax=Muntiacus reevesi TaxID=9886 RepID=A0A5N3X8W5_MUNRE|nr:hypothetical protein FD755_018107 [Muntiacus reevesi]